MASRATSKLLKPGSEFIGNVEKGATPNIRTISAKEFTTLKDQLLKGATKIGKYASGKGTWYKLKSGGRVGVRSSKNNGTTLDIDIPGLPKGFKVHQQ